MMEDLPPVGSSSCEDDDGGFPDSPENGTETIAAGEEDRGIRLDVFLSSRLGITRNFARKLVEDGNVRLLPPRKAKPGMKMVPGIAAEVTLPPPESLDLEPEEVPFGVVYEDEWLIVVDKPSGVVVHPAPGNRHGTLVHGLLHRFRDFGSFNNVLRPGIVHRLDASTSGLLVVAREQEILENLQNQFRLREVRKTVPCPRTRQGEKTFGTHRCPHRTVPVKQAPHGGGGRREACPHRLPKAVGP
jgi:Pseudouridylate synthases, 23S RNA-specific